MSIIFASRSPHGGSAESGRQRRGCARAEGEEDQEVRGAGTNTRRAQEEEGTTAPPPLSTAQPLCLARSSSTHQRRCCHRSLALQRQAARPTWCRRPSASCACSNWSASRTTCSWRRSLLLGKSRCATAALPFALTRLCADRRRALPAGSRLNLRRSRRSRSAPRLRTSVAHRLASPPSRRWSTTTMPLSLRPSGQSITSTSCRLSTRCAPSPDPITLQHARRSVYQAPLE